MINNIKIKFLLTAYLLVIVSLLLYSFTQIDLSLTLSQFSIWQIVEKFFQHIGYFNRPFSTFLYLLIVIALFLFYFLFLYLAAKNKISKKQIWILIFGTGIILFFSYNAFSYDLFNYIFDAKIVTSYHQNPYAHKALDYPQDPMLSFMRWTHRTYPYGPTWLLLTAPLSFLGFQVFLPTFFLFKSLAVVGFLGALFYTGRIIRKISPEDEKLALVFLGLNPLVIIESLVSAHNDMIMIALFLSSLYFILHKKLLRTILLFILSIGVKFATIFLLPVLILIFIAEKKIPGFKWNNIFLFMILLMIIPVIYASFRTNFQPWYLLYVLPFAAFLARKHFILFPGIIMSIFALLQYVPFLYLGNWNPPVPTYLFWLTMIPAIISVFFVIIYFCKHLILNRNHLFQKKH